MTARPARIVALPLALLVAELAPVLQLEVAGAACAAPYLIYEGGEIDRGATLAVEGAAFGDNCYDTDPPPPGEGALGNPPLRDIEILVRQGDAEFLVATGDADRDYGFAVEIIVPSQLASGEAMLVAQLPGRGDVTSAESHEVLTITDQPADPSLDPAQPATFGLEEAAPLTGPGDVRDDGKEASSSSTTWIIAVAVVTLALLAIGLVFLSRRSAAA